MYHAYSTRATSGDHDNRRILSRILELRGEKAHLLGFRNFADLVLEDRMAHSGERAQEFLDDLKEKTEARFHEENEELAAFRRRLEGPDAPRSSRGTSPTTPRSSAPRSTTSTRRRCGLTFRWSG